MDPLTEVAEYVRAHSDAAIVAHRGSADDVLATMVAAGWRLSDEVKVMHGKRIRILIPPEGFRDGGR